MLCIIDRRRLLETINSSELSLVLITHGTDTIIDTAQYLSEELSTTDKCIILTGKELSYADKCLS